MASTHRNPLHAAIQSKSAQQWSRALASVSAENLLQVCQDPNVWTQLPAFKSFLFARHILSVSRLNSDFIHSFVYNVPQFGEYVSQLDVECVSVEDVHRIVEFLFGWKRFDSVRVILNSCSEPVRKVIINKILHLRRIDILSREKDPSFFYSLQNHLPDVWDMLQYHFILKLSGFNVVQRCPHLLTDGEYREDNEQFLDHIASGHHKIYIQSSPNLFLTFLVDNNMLEDPRIFNRQLRQIKIRVWVLLIAHLYSLDCLEIDPLAALLAETLPHIDHLGSKDLSALHEAAVQIEFRNTLQMQMQALGSSDADIRKI